ncbi:GNAT family N-acetyltransferase [Microbacterium halophytorum]|uniref:GNAT family N-acetyltransferase n=1 Tax=Microbacterium halophytorum TaxID=2067568 RepID=UPI000CFB4481|nr:GNAT family N-acetyltransferase [Microbacterium halophytorum]
MSSIDARQVPVDTTSAERLAAKGLGYRSVDAQGDAFGDYYRAVSRGFLGPEPEDKEIAAARDKKIERPERLIGVYDEAEPDGFPVGTVGSWVTPMTVPGGTVDLWAISDVTVAGTHRRRGIARAMLEGELRSAAAAGVPIAGLTVTEGTIYGRYGFGPAVQTAEVTVDAVRAGWRSYEPSAAVRYVPREALVEAFAEVAEASHRDGGTPAWTGRRQQFAGVHPSVTSGEKVRGVVARDADGNAVGAMSFRLVEEGDYTKHELKIVHLEAATADAYAALWRFAISHDLVAKVTAELQPVDGALPWLVADPKAVAQKAGDHVWLRILDVPRALEARTYAGEGASHAMNAAGVLRVHDPLGFTDGTWRVEIEAGTARVFPSEMDPDVEIGIAELSAAYLGGVPLRTLADAGRVSGSDSALERIDAALRPARAPHHGFIF